MPTDTHTHTHTHLCTYLVVSVDSVSSIGGFSDHPFKTPTATTFRGSGRFPDPFAVSQPLSFLNHGPSCIQECFTGVTMPA